jgi:hypothetical protein
MPADTTIVIHACRADQLAATKSASLTNAGCAAVRETTASACIPFQFPSARTCRLPTVPHLSAGVARIGQDHRYRPQVPPLPTAVPVSFRVSAGRARHAALVQLAGNARDTRTVQPPGEHPSHMQRSGSITSAWGGVDETSFRVAST